MPSCRTGERQIGWLMRSVEEITTFVDTQPPLGASPWLPGVEREVGIVLVDHDAGWADAFSELAWRVRNALGFCVLALEHVGSTSVQGLPAKPIIDIELTVVDPDDEGAYVPRLEAAGFALRIREPWWYRHRMLRADQPNANLHVFGCESPEPLRHRIFRDWLRQDADDRALYATAKRTAAAEANALGEHVMEYNARKEQVVRQIYGRAFAAAGLLPGPLTHPDH
jgi:GrpB-like predicted nucleotidyltransferase (UPF0157 family)